jgi:hypothetical protein
MMDKNDDKRWPTKYKRTSMKNVILNYALRGSRN